MISVIVYNVGKCMKLLHSHCWADHLHQIRLYVELYSDQLSVVFLPFTNICVRHVLELILSARSVEVLIFTNISNLFLSFPLCRTLELRTWLRSFALNFGTFKTNRKVRFIPLIIRFESFSSTYKQ